MLPGGRADSAETIAAVVGHLREWREIMRAADRQHQALPVEVRAEIVENAGDGEVLRMIPHLAGLSPQTRLRAETVLSEVILLLQERLLPAQFEDEPAQLRLVLPELA